MKLSVTLIGIAALAPAAAMTAPLPRPAAAVICTACHKMAAGEKPTIGPNLWGVVGRKAGSTTDFTYSPAMSKAGFTWTRENLTAFISSPQTKVPGTKMAFGGEKDPAKQKDIIDYLASLK